MEIYFKKIADKDLEIVLRWRTDKAITKWLFTDIPFDMAMQRQWFENIKKDATQRFFVVEISGSPVGALFLKNIAGETAELGYYIVNQNYKGLSALVAPSFYTWAFQGRLNSLVIHIFADHAELINLHLLNGFKLLKMLPNHAKGKTVCRMVLTKGDYKGPCVSPAGVEW